MNDISGQRIKGYELRERIGAGGFGAVYRAHQPVLKRDVAMKIILPEYANHPDFIRRFEIEAQLVARLEHIHIVSLYDYWREPDGAYLIMRWLRGGSLRAMLRQGPLSDEDAVHIAEQIASALSAAHARGIVHRDIKPDNILLDEEGNAYLADFGIAKDLRGTVYGEKTQQELHQEGTLTGSPFYLAPEQAENMPITPQTDIYSFGIVLFEMLTGHPPYKGDKGLMAILLQHIRDPLPEVTESRPDLPSTINTVLNRATAKDPANRYEDARTLAVDFRRALYGGEATVSSERPKVVATDEDSDDLLVITKPLSDSTLIYIVDDIEITNPYKGLQAFQEADARDFFGRGTLIERLLERLRSDESELHRFLAVIGPSGSGKSSVVKAGVIPALRQGALPGSDRWYMAEMVPGADPFQELANALLGVSVSPPEGLADQLRASPSGLLDAVQHILSGEDTELLLVIDQFEEVFTLTTDQAARALFLESLRIATTNPQSRLHVIITLRADFYDRPLLYPAFGELVRMRSEVVLPLSPDEMREAIVGPAERAGMIVESGLVAAIINDVAEQPGALPLMQYALTEAFERREDNALTLEAYRASGGVLGALARRAEDLYQSANAEGQDAMRQIFLRLVTLREGAENTRRRALITELHSLADDENVINLVLDTLGRYRLLTFDHDPETRTPTVAVAHEALIRGWERLRGWLDDNREDILLQRRLAAAYQEWNKQQRDRSFLASGMRLRQFEQLVARGTIALTQEEKDYITASVAERERQEAAERERQAREARLRRRVRQFLAALAAVMAVAAVISIVLALIANDARGEAEDQRDIAERESEVSQSLRLATSAQIEMLNENVPLAIALALQANTIPDPPSESRFILAQTAFKPGTRHLFEQGPIVTTVDYSPDGETMLAGDLDGKIVIWDMATYEQVQFFPADDEATEDALEGHTAYIRIARFTPDGEQVLSGGADGRLILWDVASGDLLRTFEPDGDEADPVTGHTGQVRDLAFNPLDPDKVFTGGNDNTVIYWDIATGDILWHSVPDDPDTEEVEGHSAAVREVAISPDGSAGVSASYDSTLVKWDLETGAELCILAGHTDQVTSVDYSPDGTRILSGGGSDLSVRVWDAETCDELRVFENAHDEWVKTVRYSPDGSLFLTSGDDNRVRVWSLISDDNTPITQLDGHTNFVEEATFSPDGLHIVSGSGDGTARLWDVLNGAELRRFLGHTNQIQDVAISPDGETALSADFDGMVRRWDLNTGAPLGEFAVHDDLTTVLAFSPDGQTVISSEAIGAGTGDENTPDLAALLWDIDSGEVVQALLGHTSWVDSAAFHPGGELLVTGGRDRRIIIWDRATGEALRTIEVYEDWVSALAFNADGTRLLSGGDNADPRLMLWDTSSANVDEWEMIEIAWPTEHSSAVTAVHFSPDGTQFLSSAKDRLIIVWDAQSGAVLHTLQHDEAVKNGFFIAGGAQIASYDDSQTAHIWDISGERAREVYRLVLETYAESVAITPDGTRLLTGGPDGIPRLWHIEPQTVDDLVEWTYANRHVIAFSAEQCAEYDIMPCDAESAATGD